MADVIPSAETRLTTLCLEIFANNPEIRSISFRVDRQDDEFQTYRIGRQGVMHDPE